MHPCFGIISCHDDERKHKKKRIAKLSYYIVERLCRKINLKTPTIMIEYLLVRQNGAVEFPQALF
jgi:hypothetical protein